MMRLPILTYHGIVAATKTNKNRYNISIDEFANQMNLLYELGYRTLTLSQLSHPESFYDRSSEIAITFDDGHESNFTYVAPILKKYGFTGIFFVTTSLIGEKDEFMNWQQINELQKMGHSIQSHTHSHRSLNQLSREEIEFELRESRHLICRFTNVNPTTFSCPGGRFNRRVTEIAKTLGFNKMFTSEPAYFEPEKHEHNFLLGRWMVTDEMDIRQFRRLLKGDRIFLSEHRIKYFLKNGIKKLLGENLYHNLYPVRKPRLF